MNKQGGITAKTMLSAANFDFFGHCRLTFKLLRALMSDIADRVKNIVVEHLGVDADKVVEGASFIDDLGADSLDTVELVMAFEEEFGVEIPDAATYPDSERCGISARKRWLITTP